MADDADQEIYKVVLKAEGEAEILKLAKAIQQEEKFLQDLIDTYGQFSAQAKTVASNVDALKAKFSTMNAQFAEIDGGAKKAGQSWLRLGNLIDDFQYVPQQGLRPVINNVMQMAPAIGTALVAVQLLYTNWDLLSTLFGEGHVKTQADEMEELKKQTSLTADEAERLKRASALGQKVGALHGAQTAAQKAEAGAVQKSLEEAGLGNVAREVLKNRPDLVDGQGDVPAALKKVKDIDAYIAERKRRIASPDLDDKYRAQAVSELAGAQASSVDAKNALRDARQRTAEEIAAKGTLPELFPGGRKELADALRPGMDATAKELGAADPLKVEATKRAEGFKKLKEKLAKDDEAAFDKEAQRQYHDQTQAGHDIIQGDERMKREAEAARKEQDRFMHGGRGRKGQDAPGLDEAMAAQVKAAMMAGASKLDAQAALGRQGFSMGDAARAGDAAKSELMTDYIKGTKSRNSSVIGSEGLADAIQSAVGGDVLQKQLEELRKQSVNLQVLADAVRGNGGGSGPVFGANGVLGGGN